MTQSGIESTLQGEFEPGKKNLYSFNKDMSISYSLDTENRNQVEVKMNSSSQAHLPLFQMIFVLKGKLTFTNTDQGHGHQQLESQQHNLFRIPPQSRVKIKTEVEDEIICINLSSSFLSRYLPHTHPAYQQLTSVNSSEEISGLTRSNMHMTPEISSILQRLSNSTQSNFSEQLLLESKIIELLALQIAQFEQHQISPVPSMLKNTEVERMHKAREILIRDIREQVSLRALAHLVGTNEFSLKRNFKIAFGTTVFGYLNQHKMELAKSTLIEDDINIAELSTRMGFKHATHFTSAFKKYFGYLPTKIKYGKLSLLMFVEDLFMLVENLGLVI